jgi:hypothetical protein
MLSNYIEKYDVLFENLANQNITLLELGVNRGGSILLWRDYFSHGKIVGLDIKLPKDIQPTDNIYLFEGSQSDIAFLSDVANQTASEGFDVIIDDASHIGSLTKTAFWYLFDNHLKSNGLFIIEDWGTGYWDNWPDGKNLNLESYKPSSFQLNQFWLKVFGKLKIKKPMKNHAFGMVGFIKQLIDEQGASDATANSQKPRASKFESMTIYPGMVVIRKK